MLLTELCSENLFLLEFVVEFLKIKLKCLPTEIRSVEGVTCLSLTFLDNGPLEITEEEFNGEKVKSSTQNGKSILFPLNPTTAKEAIDSFDIIIKVYRQFDNILPDRLKIGETFISIKDEFSKIVQRIEREGNKEPISESQVFNIGIRGTIPGGKFCIGELSIYMRCTCFGKMIVNEITSPSTAEPSNVASATSFKRKYSSLCKYRRSSLRSQSTQPSTANTAALLNLRCAGGADRFDDEHDTELSDSFSDCKMDCPGPDICLADREPDVCDDVGQKKRKSVSFPCNLPCGVSSMDSYPSTPKIPPCRLPPLPCVKQMFPCGPSHPCSYGKCALPTCVYPPYKVFINN